MRVPPRALALGAPTGMMPGIRMTATDKVPGGVRKNWHPFSRKKRVVLVDTRPGSERRTASSERALAHSRTLLGTSSEEREFCVFHTPQRTSRPMGRSQ